MPFTLKILISACVISFSSWLAGKRPALAGFIMALPLSTLLALAFTHIQYKDTEKSVEFAKSILIGLPLTLSFFIPFLMANKLRWPFWALYGSGVLLLTASYFIHRMILRD